MDLTLSCEGIKITKSLGEIEKVIEFKMLDNRGICLDKFMLLKEKRISIMYEKACS